MQIDWVTVIAQIVNFLILVGLLKYLLYGPITRAMHNRRQSIQDQLEEAREREREAEQEQEEYEQKRRELEERREELVEQARSEAQERREEMLEEAREQVQGVERRWHESLRDERDAFLRELRDRMGARVCVVARQALRDLADAELEAQMVSIFLDRLNELDDEHRRDLRRALDEADRPPRVVTTFELSEDQREGIQSAVRDVLDADVSVAFRQSRELLCGIELNVGGRKIAWSLDSYLDRLEENISEVLEREVEEEEVTEEAEMPPAEVEPRDEEDDERPEAD